ncbi:MULTISPECIES: hypothetical protein [unclassified Nocardia]|uniref:hypothetical protein n=1 Tax=unclassified Nocardia TaxID=2637762 RepID=UPI0024A9DC0E|nr:MULTISPECIES: hypothetical protein [unclassified Nocardia]
MAVALRDFQKALAIDESGSEEDSLRTSLFANAMSMLIGVNAGIVRNELSSPDDFNRFRSQVASLMSRSSRSLFSYLYMSMDYAIRARVDGWHEPCVRRSAIQLLIDDYPPSAEVFDSEDRETVEEMDEWLRDRAPDIAPLPSRLIPEGIPSSHWWWRLPSAEPDTTNQP